MYRYRDKLSTSSRLKSPHKNRVSSLTEEWSNNEKARGHAGLFF